jgi:hypothetical protein|tara:strand:- start:157 stop:336 length:180 start_codon:yes stop_codon:yes gene_type:complete
MIIRAKRTLASMHNERNFSALDRRIKEKDTKKIFVKGSKVSSDKPQNYQDYIDQFISRN